MGVQRAIAKISLLVISSIWLVGCGSGGDGEQSPPDIPYNAYITVEEAEQPITCISDYEFDIQPGCELKITGRVYHEVSPPCFDPNFEVPRPIARGVLSARETINVGVAVTWESKYSTTAAGGTIGDFGTVDKSVFGNASLEWKYPPSLPDVVRCARAHWYTAIPLAIGKNRTVFTAIGVSGQVVETEYNMECRIGGAMANEVTCQCDAPLDPTIPFDCRS